MKTIPFKFSSLAIALLPLIFSPAFADTASPITTGDFVSNGDGTVTHKPSGLMWQACSVGQTWDVKNNICTGSATAPNYTDAMALTSDFAGHTDWRVPTISELRTLVNIRRYNPSIDSSLFPNTPNDWYWSATPYSSNQANAWCVHFGSGRSEECYRPYGYDVRLVRGGQFFSLQHATDFVDNLDGTVTHNKTGLTWQRCVMGRVWTNGICEGTETGYKHDAAVKLTSDFAGKTDWRLPTQKELQSIIDYATYSPTVNSTVFPDTPNGYFWTNTNSKENSAYKWYVDFNSGKTTYTGDINNEWLVRMVRGSQLATYPDTVDLNTSLTASPNPVNVGQTLTYSATVTNKGAITATGTTLTFYLAPKAMTFVAAEGCTAKTLSVVCTIGDMAPSASVTRTMTVTATKAGGVSSTALVKASEVDINSADNIGRAVLAIKK